MTEWVEAQTIRHGNCTVTVYRPVLTPNEKKKRENQIRDTVGGVMREYIHRKDEKRDK